MLDLWQNDATNASPQPNEGADLPATFTDEFSASWHEGQLFNQSIAGENARLSALSDYLDDIKTKTGNDISSQLDYGGESGVATPASALMDQANEQVAKLNKQRPDLNISPLTQDDLEGRAVAKSRAALNASAEMGAREQTFGGRVGGMLGGMASAATDPINIATLPIAPETESVGILAAALRWGVVAGVSQAGIEAAGGAYHEEADPGYLESGAPLANVAGAFGGGMVLGGGTKALGNIWSRVKTGAWPQSVRDAGNVVESEANIQQSNVLPGAQGEVEHRESMGLAVGQILQGVPVDVASASRELVGRLDAEAPFTLPVMDHDAIRLISEEAGLRERSGQINDQLGGIPAGDVSAADRLNRLQAVEQQIATAPDDATRRVLNERRDQILVDTTPEKLQEAAAPIGQRRNLEAEQAQIESRLQDIAQQRANFTPNGEKFPTGQRMPVPRQLFDIHEGRIESLMDMRGLAGDVSSQAATERAASTAVGELPFRATTLDVLHDFHVSKISDGVRVLAQLGGHDMPDMEATELARRIAQAHTDNEARAILNQITDRPRTLAQTLPSSADFAAHFREEAERATPIEPVANPEQVVGSPAHDVALRADIDRERMTGDRQIPVGVDAEGEPIMRSLDGAMDEVDAYHAAADQIQACASGPAPEAETEEA